jgi:hypothetical protein
MLGLVAGLAGSGLAQAATTDLTGNSAWTALLKGTRFDPFTDTQAQKAGTEIVGDVDHASFYYNYDDGGTAGVVGDDILSMRIRIGDETKSSHSAYVFVGIDADEDGQLDAFVSSGAGKTELWVPGSDSNTSPNTTDIASSASIIYTQDASNYDFAVVSALNDTDWSGNDDLNGDTQTDVFVSFTVTIGDLATVLASKGISFDAATGLRFVSLSATQTNALNSDFNGIDDGTLYDWDLSYAELGLFTPTVTSTGLIDNIPPVAPTVDSQRTNNTQPTITGSFDSNDADGGFRVSVDGSSYTLGIDAALSSSGDTWSLDLSVAGQSLAEGAYDVVATATDGASPGNSSNDNSSNELVIDLSGPVPPTVVSQTTSDTTPIITGTYDSADSATLSVTVNSVAYTLGDGNLSAGGDDWTLAIPAGDALTEGTWEVTATAADAQGNSSSDISSNELVIDLSAPLAPTVQSLVTNSTTPTLSGSYDSAAAVTLTVTVNSIDYTLGDGNLSANGDDWSLIIPAGDALAEATYPVTATAADGVGNTVSDVTDNELVIDLSAPAAPTVASQVTANSQPTLSGTVDSSDAGGGFSVSVDGSSYALGSDAALSVSGDSWSLDLALAGKVLVDDTYEVLATVTDEAGNSAADVTANELRVDSSAPLAPTVESLTTADTTPTLSGTFDSSDAAGGLVVRVNGTDYVLGEGDLSASGNDWTLLIPEVDTLAEGVYEVVATASDEAGNAANDASSNELTIEGDSDGDTISDSLDLDDDNDGIPDSVEGDGAVDSDGDLIPDSLDLDADNDGLLDLTESGIDNPGALDSNHDGRIDSGFGSNGLADSVESSADSGSLGYSVADSDGDEVEDFRDLDSDNDGINDVIESGGSDGDRDGVIGSDSPAVDLNGIPSGGPLGAADEDGDGSANFRDLDSDGDGVNDVSEAGGSDGDADGIVGSGAPVVDPASGLPAGGSLLPADEDGDGNADYLDNTDSDGDAIPDTWDLDDDNDGIPDSDEGVVDSDGDGIRDSLDLDSDNDGLYDLIESGVAAPLSLDSDNDGRIDGVVGDNGLADAVESAADSGTRNYSVADSDGDGVADFRDLDSDNDGLFDVTEADGNDGDNDGTLGSGMPSVDIDGLASGAGLSPRDSDADGVADFRDLDSDNDGLFDVTESGGNDGNGDGLLGDSAPLVVGAMGVAADAGQLPRDSDEDGVEDQRDRDSDNDGIPDVTEAGGDDADGDGIIGSGMPNVDASGVAGGALVPVDTDGDGIEDQRELDADNDGISDLVEAGGIDSDEDGLVDGFVDLDGDGYDDGLGITPLLPPDSDLDGVPDYQDRDDSDNDGIVDEQDRDDDNDGIPDLLEGDGRVDTDNDGVPDSLDLDSDNDGLYDLSESGSAQGATLDGDDDGRIDADNPVGSNGLADVVEDGSDSGVVNYHGGEAVDSDGDGVPDFRDLDSDNDGIPDVTETGGSDADGDGIIGSGLPTVNREGIAAGTGNNAIDTDEDGLPDFRDLDADNDGKFDLVEAGGSDVDSDGLVDGFTDTDGNGYDDTISAAPLPISDSDRNGKADFQQLGDVTAPIRTGVQGIGGCSVAPGAPFDPLLPLLLLLSVVAVNRKRIRAVVKGEVQQ